MQRTRKTRKASSSELAVRVQEDRSINWVEERMIRTLERRKHFKDYEQHFEKLRKGSLEVPAFFQELSHEALMVTIETMRSEDERLAFDAAKDVLDRAGFSKTQKIAVGHVHVDHQTSKTELINLIMSSAKKVGLAVKDVDHVQGHLDDGNTIDVTPDELSHGADVATGCAAEVSDDAEKPARDDPDH